MAKKTYKTYHLKGLQVLLFDESGRMAEVNFRSGAQIDSTAKFSTNDKKVQEALEKCSGFNRDFYLESIREDVPAAKEEPKVAVPSAEAEEVVEETAATEPDEKVNVVKVATKGDAVEWLKEHFPEEGYTSVKLRGKAFDEACKKHGVVFELER